MVKWRDLVDEATAALASSGIAEPSISATRIAQRATGAEGGEWLETLDRDATIRQVASFDAMVARRRGGEPLQYVVGGWGFRTLDLYLDARVLIPRPETEMVAEAAIAEVRRARAEGMANNQVTLVADLGTGSGAIGLSVAAEVSDVDVWLTDISDDALAVARANLAGLGARGGRVRLAGGSWFDALPEELAGRFSVVVSNPPYVADSDEIEAQVADWEPALALFAPHGGTAELVQLIDEAPGWLADNGALVLEMAPDQVAAMVDRAGRYFARTEVVVDMAGRNRGLVARHPRRSGRGVRSQEFEGIPTGPVV